MSRWRSPRPERALACAALVAALAGAAIPPVARATWTRFQVWDALPLLDLAGDESQPMVPDPVEAGGRDPWGRPWRTGSRSEGWVVWSVGPDGADERGAGDDVLLDPSMARVDDASAHGVRLALALLWLAATLRALRAPRGPQLWAELVRSAVAGSGPAVVATVALAARVDRATLASATPRGVPWKLSALGTVWLAASLAALAWRTRQGAARTTRRAAPRGLIVGLVAAGAAAGCAQRIDEQLLSVRARQRRLGWACLGAHNALEDLFSRHALAVPDALEDLGLLLAAPPAIDLAAPVLSASVDRLLWLGPRANPLMVRALSGRGALSPAPLRHLLAHDPGLESLAAAVHRDPARHGLLLLLDPSLGCAFAGPTAVVGLLLAGTAPRSQALAARLAEAFGGPEAGAGVDARRAWWAAGPTLADGWVLVAFGAAHDRTADWSWRARIEGGSEVERVGVAGERALVVLGPFLPSPPGRRLVLEGPSTVEVELPAIGPGGWVWVEVDPDRRQASARWIARPE